MALKQPRVVAHITALGSSHWEECVRRVQWWADDVFVAPASEFFISQPAATVPDGVTWNPLTGRPGQDSWWPSTWEYFEHHMKLAHGDFVFMLTDSQIVVEHNLVRKMARENPATAVGTHVHMFYDEDHYRTDAKFRPYFSYQLFPWKPGAVPHESYMPAVPSYVYALPYRNNPHLTIADYRHYGDDEGDMALKEWKSVVARV